MKPSILAFALLCASLLAAQATPPAASSSAMGDFSTNLVEKNNGPSYGEMVCAGGVLDAKISGKQHVIGGKDNDQANFSVGDLIYLAGGGYEVGAKFFLIRKAVNVNKDEYYPGEESATKKYGVLWAVVGVTQIAEVVDGVGVGRIVFSCDSVLPGDRLIPYTEPPTLAYTRPKTLFREFNAPAGDAVGRVLEGKDSSFYFGEGDIVYVSLGSDKGVKVGDYLRISRGYKSKVELPPDDKANDHTPADDPTDHTRVTVTNADLDSRPRHGVGEAMVISVNGRTATAIITLSVEDIHPGDRVETIPR